MASLIPPGLFSEVAGDAGSSAFCTRLMVVHAFYCPCCIKAKIQAVIAHQYRVARAVSILLLNDAIKVNKNLACNSISL